MLVALGQEVSGIGRLGMVPESAAALEDTPAHSTATTLTVGDTSVQPLALSQWLRGKFRPSAASSGTARAAISEAGVRIRRGGRARAMLAR